MLRHLLLTFILLPAMVSCGKNPDVAVPEQTIQEQGDGQKNNGTNNTGDMPSHIKITVSGETLPVKIEDNAATRALVTALKEGSITYDADDYGGFEKVGALGRTLPTNNSQITTRPGDVILYSGDQIVLFYGSNSWNYTRIGIMEYDSLNELKSFLKAGEGKISVTLSLDTPQPKQHRRSR